MDTFLGDYGRVEGKKVFMGVAQIMVDDLDLSNIVIGRFIHKFDPELNPLLPQAGTNCLVRVLWSACHQEGERTRRRKENWPSLRRQSAHSSSI